MAAKKALITGVRGQDGAYLARLLLDKGYRVWGGDRRRGDQNNWRLRELAVADDIEFVYLDLLEITNILRVLDQVQPDEIYNLAAQSFVGASFEQPILTSEVNALGVMRLLEAIRTTCPETKFYQASTSEMFGLVQETPQRETTSFYPRSPYGISKLYAHWATVNYREAYEIFACSGILFNHESPLRGREFVTRKITSSLARIRHGLQEVLVLGNLEARRDWGYAGEYVEAMWKMIQHTEADDYVVATGKTHSVREFVDLAAQVAGFDLAWEGEGVGTRGIDRKTNREIVQVSPEFYRPVEVDALIGDGRKVAETLGWKPQVELAELVEMMVDADLRREERKV